MAGTLRHWIGKRRREPRCIRWDHALCQLQSETFVRIPSLDRFPQLFVVRLATNYGELIRTSAPEVPCLSGSLKVIAHRRTGRIR